MTGPEVGGEGPGREPGRGTEHPEDVPARWFTARNGMRLAADEWGDPAAPAVVLVHGGGQTRHSWGGTAAALAAQGWHAVAYDQRGHGRSDRAPDRDYGNQRFAEDVVDVAAEVRAASGVAPVLVGASLGGLASLLAEGDLAPGTCRALVLVDITPRMEPDGVRRIVGFMLDRVEEGFGSLEEAAAAIAEYQPHRPPPSDLRGLSKNLRRDPDGRWRWHWDPDFFLGPLPVGAGQAHGRFEAATRALAVPTLLVRGRLSDLVSEETAAEFLALCPRAGFVDVSEAGHMVAGDRNDAFTEAVATFLAGLPSPGQSPPGQSPPGRPR
jgi:pimeloyl-ACP methyl ester carboxylesterase